MDQTAEEEPSEESPILVYKDGVLVVKAKATGDVEDVVNREHDKRLSELIERTGL